MGASDIKVKFGADDSRLERNLKAIQKKVLKSAKAMESAGRNMMQGITVPLIAAGTTAISALAKVDKLRKGLLGMMGDADRAAAEFQNLQKLAKQPGLDLQSTIKGSIRLQAIGYEAGKARNTLKTLANAVALVGGSGEDLGGVALAITQIISKGKVQAEEINQIAERLPQVRKAMQDAFGSADTEVLQKMGMEAEDFVDGVVKELAKLPPAQASVSDQLTNMKDTFMLLAANIGSKVFPIFNKLMGIVSNVINLWSSLSESTKSNIVTYGLLVAAIGPALFALGKLKMAMVAITKLSTIKALFSPWNIAIAGIAAGAYLIAKNWDLVKEKIVQAGNYFIDLYNTSLLFRGEVEGIKMVFNNLVETVKLIGKVIMNTFSTVGKVVKTALKGSFKDIPGMVKEAFVEQATMFAESGVIMGENMKNAVDNTFKPLKQRHINEEDVDKFFAPVVEKAQQIKKTIGDLMSGGMAGGGSDEDFVNTDTPAVKKEEVGALEMIKTLGGVEDKSKDVAEQVGKTIRIVHNGIKQGMDYTNASFQDLINGLMRGTLKLKDLTLANIKEIAGFVGNVLGQAVASIGDIMSNNFDRATAKKEAYYDGEIAMIERSRMSEESKTQKIIALEKAKEREMKKLARQKAKRDRSLAIFQATIQTAVGIASNLANPIAAIAAGILGGLQIAAIASEPLPGFENGGVFRGENAIRVGEYSNAPFDPEVVGKLSEVSSLVGGAGNNRSGNSTEVHGTLVARGPDLVSALENATTARDRKRA